MLNQQIEGPFCIEVAPTPCVTVFFGGTGDLATRKLFPSLVQLHRLGLLHQHSRIIACGRTRHTENSFREHVAAALHAADAVELTAFLERITYLTVDADDPASFSKLSEHLETIDRIVDTPAPLNRIYYLAVPPASYQSIITLLAATGQIRKSDCDSGAWCHLLLEKPFGTDLTTAENLDVFLKTVADERQIFRIDHYLGKETIQNIMILRFANIIFEPLWNARYVDHVQITVAETLGVENRAAYFEQNGLLRDMFQNHLVEMLALTAMDPPEHFDADSIHARKLELIRAIRPFSTDGRSTDVVRAQYHEGHDMLAYRQEKGVAPESSIETFVAAKFWIDTTRWQGVPFYLRAGKRLDANSSTITVVFKPSPHLDLGRPGANALVLRASPDEGMRLHLQAKYPGPKMCVRDLPLSFDYADLTTAKDMPDAYARLLLDAMLHDHTLFVRNDTIKASWKLFMPLLEMWRDHPDRCPLLAYAAGSKGPAAADDLLAADGRSWLPDTMQQR